MLKPLVKKGNQTRLVAAKEMHIVSASPASKQNAATRIQSTYRSYQGRLCSAVGKLKGQNGSEKAAAEAQSSDIKYSLLIGGTVLAVSGTDSTDCEKEYEIVAQQKEVVSRAGDRVEFHVKESQRRFVQNRGVEYRHDQHVGSVARLSQSCKRCSRESTQPDVRHSMDSLTLSVGEFDSVVVLNSELQGRKGARNDGLAFSKARVHHGSEDREVFSHEEEIICVSCHAKRKGSVSPCELHRGLMRKRVRPWGPRMGTATSPEESRRSSSKISYAEVSGGELLLNGVLNRYRDMVLRIAHSDPFSAIEWEKALAGRFPSYGLDLTEFRVSGARFERSIVTKNVLGAKWLTASPEERVCMDGPHNAVSLVSLANFRRGTQGSYGIQSWLTWSVSDVAFALLSFRGRWRGRTSYALDEEQFVENVLCRLMTSSGGSNPSKSGMTEQKDWTVGDVEYGDIKKSVRRALTKMRADIGIVHVRGMAWTLTKVWKQLFRGLKVQFRSLERLHNAARSGATLVFLPTHKSHVDYLLLSYITYAYGLPLPYIAAGDNLDMPVIGSLLRSTGGFFIKRSIGEDSVYKETLKEYLDVLARSKCALEFFIEGGRSRTGLVLPPKLGMLGMVLDNFLVSLSESFCNVDGHRQSLDQCYRGAESLMTTPLGPTDGAQSDMMLVPVSIDYERVLEAGEYGRQRAGKPKDPESLSSLLCGCLGAFKATCGDVMVSFGEGISLKEKLAPEMASLRQVSGELAGRTSNNDPFGLGPGSGPVPDASRQVLANAAVASECRRLARDTASDLGLEVSIAMQELGTVPCTAVVCAALLSEPSLAQGVAESVVLERCCCFIRLLEAMGKKIVVSDAAPLQPRRCERGGPDRVEQLALDCLERSLSVLADILRRKRTSRKNKGSNKGAVVILVERSCELELAYYKNALVYHLLPWIAVAGGIVATMVTRGNANAPRGSGGGKKESLAQVQLELDAVLGQARAVWSTLRSVVVAREVELAETCKRMAEAGLVLITESTAGPDLRPHHACWRGSDSGDSNGFGSTLSVCSSKVLALLVSLVNPLIDAKWMVLETVGKQVLDQRRGGWKDYRERTCRKNETSERASGITLQDFCAEVHGLARALAREDPPVICPEGVCKEFVRRVVAGMLADGDLEKTDQGGLRSTQELSVIHASAQLLRRMRRTVSQLLMG